MGKPLYSQISIDFIVLWTCSFSWPGKMMIDRGSLHKWTRCRLLAESCHRCGCCLADRIMISSNLAGSSSGQQWYNWDLISRIWLYNILIYIRIYQTHYNPGECLINFSQSSVILEYLGDLPSNTSHAGRCFWSFLPLVDALILQPRSCERDC